MRRAIWYVSIGVVGLCTAVGLANIVSNPAPGPMPGTVPDVSRHPDDLELGLANPRPPDNRDASYFPGEPVNLEFSLLYREAVDVRNRAHHRKEAHPTIPTLVLAPASSSWLDFVVAGLYRKTSLGWRVMDGYDWRANAMLRSPQTAMAREIGADSLRVPFVVPPSLTAKMEAGTYQVRGVFDTRRSGGSGWKGRVEATPIEFTIKAVPRDAREQSWVLIHQARHAARSAQDMPEAERLADQATERDPTNNDAWYELMVTAQMNRNWEVVAAAARKYLELHRPADEVGHTDHPVMIVRGLLRLAEKRLAGE